MTFQVEAALTGIHSRAEETVRTSRDLDRGRASEEDLKGAFQRDTASLLSLEASAGFSKVSDGQLMWQDFIRPFSESVIGLRSGADLSRWFDTNTFYKKPTVVGELQPPDSGLFLLEKYSLQDKDDFFGKAKNERKISLPGPFTLASLVDDAYYHSKTDLIFSFAKLLSKIIAGISKSGISCVQLNEPSLVYRYGESALTNAAHREAYLNAVTLYLSTLPVKLWLHTYFGDSSKILKDLVSLPGIFALGIDFTQTSLNDIESIALKDKFLACGCVDARNSLIETPEWIADFCYDSFQSLNPKGLIILPTSDLKYLPRSCADQKVTAIGKAAQILKGKIG